MNEFVKHFKSFADIKVDPLIYQMLRHTQIHSLYQNTEIKINLHHQTSNCFQPNAGGHIFVFVLFSLSLMMQ